MIRSARPRPAMASASCASGSRPVSDTSSTVPMALTIPSRLRAVSAVGVPYTEEELTDGVELARAQAAALIAEIVERSLAARGVTLHLGVRVESADVATGALQLTDGSKIDAPERVMMATGRRPRVDGLDLDAAGVAYTARGIGADEWGRTSVDGVWAIGDVTGNTLTTHGAGATGRRTVRAIAFPHAPKIARKRAIPAAVYSTPEVASVGLSLDELADWDPAGRRRIVVDYADIDRGFIDDIADGRLVLDVQRFNGKVLRAAIVGPGASNMIGLFTMAIDHGLGLRTLFPMVHPYPSHAEVLREAADQFAATTLNNIPTELSAAVRSRLRRTLRRKR